ncbi:2-succinyl-5-enolpyruvyl-6-hydroxy-3-cyclohexene-1-carboxylate synthase [Vibrio astriarenae]|uniref:2-succinyl-5-enolpyruvyl-6-hydroxy-3-cyclohexene-1-carboxylate synthase n=1 Tax=Vibrio astriarenae TaxID=1481923 RepID=A0A7Z2T4Z7_9VIBR|nr:thiamine pyrophosphate-binding protein [Vibrio astriarenae]QIA64431.1 2-succinyl-5-enolpyruvyl-6-hydroxy-3-cyclohexene-1-carboxylate synthase [Vibrio astriarenae]
MTQLITKEKNAQIVISLLKSHGINKVVASPGTTNVALIGSIQNDPYFKIYSAVDERSAAYMACGLAEETGEPVVISCTGATASRNYAPGLTEAYYRKLPVLAITSMQDFAKVGHLVAQTLDRSTIQNDVAKLSVELPIVKDKDDIWNCEIKVNRAILELTRNGGGPVHINIPSTYTLPFERSESPRYKKIERHFLGDNLPHLKGKVAVFVGAHKRWTELETEALDKFCEVNNAAVFCDHSSGYKGKYRVLTSLLSSQVYMNKEKYRPDTLIHIGEVSGDYSIGPLVGKEVWRVNEDGELRDTFRKLTNVFEMKPSDFFKQYSSEESKTSSYFESINESISGIKKSIPDLPFSNIWMASKLSSVIPNDSNLHFAILNSLRSWNFFEIDSSINTSSNVGGFGIDGALSTTLGASLANTERLNFCIVGDLAFFYDMNALGNRHVGKNLRILVINNGKGTEFKNYNHHAAYFMESSDEFIAAANHFGNKSPSLIKDYVQNLGFDYLSASSKADFEGCYRAFVDNNVSERSIVLEVFTNHEDESKALELMNSIVKDHASTFKVGAKKILGKGGINVVKKVLNK